MPFNTLMLHFLMSGTSFTESVRVKPEPKETILFFRIDDKYDKSKREKLKIEGKICDLIVFYRQDGKFAVYDH